MLTPESRLLIPECPQHKSALQRGSFELDLYPQRPAHDTRECEMSVMRFGKVPCKINRRGLFVLLMPVQPLSSCFSS